MNNKLNRRQFIRTLGISVPAFACTSVLAPTRAAAAKAPTSILNAAPILGNRTVLHCDDGGYYYYADYMYSGGSYDVVWFGGRADGAFGNIFVGRPYPSSRQTVNYILGTWWDVPYGRSLNSGQLLLKVDEAEGKGFSRTNPWDEDLDIPGFNDGGFGGSRWFDVNLKGHRYLPLPSSPWYVGPERLTGLWRTDTEALYYIRETDSNVVWFAARPDHAAANVFWGKRNGSSVTGTWIDVLWGRTSATGELSLDVDEYNDYMVKSSSSAPYGSTEFHKLEE